MVSFDAGDDSVGGRGWVRGRCPVVVHKHNK